MSGVDSRPTNEAGRVVAERIAAERAAHAWSQRELARRMTDLGFTMYASTIFKIEQGEPRRRITVDELFGFAAAFGVPAASMLDDFDEVDFARRAVDRANARLADALRAAQMVD